jgi:hypothetical protein
MCLTDFLNNFFLLKSFYALMRDLSSPQ